MGKAKKGKRTDKDDDVDSDFELEEQVNVSSKAKVKDKKKKKSDDIDEITEEMDDLKVDKKPAKKGRKGADDSDEEMEATANSTGRKGSFAPTVDGGDSDSEAESSKPKQKVKKNKKGKKAYEDSDEEEEEVPKQKVKKNKKGKKGHEDSDEEVEVPKQKAKKNKKGKKGQEDSDEEEEEVPKQKVKKNKKGKKGQEDSGDEEVEEPKQKVKKNKKGKKGHEDTDDEEEEEQQQKGKEIKKGKKQVESDESDFDTKKSKGKSKGKKNFDSDASDDEEESVKGKNKGKAKGKNKGRKASESEDDFSIEKAKPEKAKPVKTNKAVKGGFALLDVEGGDDDNNENEEEPPIESENESEKTTSVNQSKNAKQLSAQDQKKGKKGKKKRNDSVEDIDKVLAELELEYEGEKKGVEEVPKSEEDDQKKGKGKEKEKEKTEAKDEEDQEGGTVKSAAQKKKERKERERQKKIAQKKAEAIKKVDEPQKTEEKEEEKPAEKVPEGEDAEEGKVGGKKKKGAKEDPKDKAKGPKKKVILAMQEALKKAKEEEERLLREEEERIRLEEEREEARLLAIKLEQERKEKKKLKEKQRKERLKAEGKLLTPKQKQAQMRQQALLESLKASGLMPEAAEKKPRPGTRIKPAKMKSQTSTEEKEEKKEENATEVQVEIVDIKQQKVVEEKKEDEVKDSWDAESSDEQEEDKSDKSDEGSKDEKQNLKEATPGSENETESVSDQVSNSEEASDDDSDVDDKITDAQRKKERVKLRIEARRTEAEKKKSLDDLRAGIVCVLGHVDTGKTKILDKLRRTNVQDGEAGGITQQIGATNVPIQAIYDSTRHVKEFADKKLRIPGLLIIDTPGHESFSNLRSRGSSLCDIAILVVDIMHGLELQTIESINLLKSRKTYFVVALNKIDRIYDWNSEMRKDVQDIIKLQSINAQREFDKRCKEVIVQFAEQGLNAALFYDNPDPKTYVSLVPTSAITGEGMGNLLALIVDYCQGPLAKKLMYSEELQATVLEVKALPGLGTTIDCILVNGMLREGDTMIVAGTDGPIVTSIRSLLMPQPMKELRVKNAYIEHREVKAAQGVKIAAKDLEKAIAGLNLQIARKPDEVEVLREEIAEELSHVLGKIKVAERGVFVQASTLGALEALLDFLKTSKIPYAGIRIGPVVKKDVMRASIMLEHDIQYATILAFDVKIEKEAQEAADSIGVKIFQADIIYHLFDKFTAYREELRQRKREEHKHIAVFPCKLKVMPQFVFKTRDPIVAGVMVEAGIIRPGTPVCVPSKDFVDLGVVTSVEMNHKSVDSARKGQEVCIKIEPIPGEAPKMFGRHFDEKDLIISKISRQSIDACKNYFRDDLLKTDWQLMLELKNLFEII